MTRDYTISEDRKSITCHRCSLTSHNINDVRQRYCGRCKVFHDDLNPDRIMAHFSAIGATATKASAAMDAMVQILAEKMVPALKRISDDIDAYLKNAGKR